MITDEDIAARLEAAEPPRQMQLPPVDTLVTLARRRRSRRRAAAASLALTAIAGGAISIALTAAQMTDDGKASLVPARPPAAATTAPSTVRPGEDVVTPLTDPSTSEGGGGTHTIALGARPAAANKVELQLTCLSSGTFNFHDGGAALCSMSDGPGEQVTPQALRLPLEPGETTLTMTASSTARWRLTTRYVRAVPSAWGVNASGQTFGVPNEKGMPDLIAVQATNGRQGYVYATQRFPALSRQSQAPARQESDKQTQRLPVYLSDGRTRIGDFVD